MPSLVVNFITDAPDGEEDIISASLDIQSGVVSPGEDWPEGLNTREAWIEIYGGNELFFRVVVIPGSRDYQVVYKEGLDRCRDQLDWLAESFRISGQRGRYVGAKGAVCVL